MKKVFFILMVALAATVVMVSCGKHNYMDDIPSFDDSTTDTTSVTVDDGLAGTQWGGYKGNPATDAISSYYLVSFAPEHACSLAIDTYYYGANGSSMVFNGSYYYGDNSGQLSLDGGFSGSYYRDNFTIYGNTLTLVHLENTIILTKK